MKAKAVKFYESRLVVKGMGEFPYDMLRYDSCFPDSSDDAAKLNGRYDEVRTITLRRRSASIIPATAGRWESFCWKVVEETPFY